MEFKESRINEVAINGKPVNNNNIIFEVYKSICRIIYYQDNKYNNGTGFFIKFERED